MDLEIVVLKRFRNEINFSMIQSFIHSSLTKNICKIYTLEMPRTPTPWNLHVKKVWNENKHKEGYKFKQALKDAAKSWKTGSKTKRTSIHADHAENEAEPMAIMKKNKKGVRKTRKSRKA